MPPASAQVDIAAVTSLLQWRSKNKADRQADEASSIELAQQLLANDTSLAAIEATLHVSRSRVLQAMLEYAVFLATKNEASSSPSANAQSFLFLSKAMLQTTSYQLSLQLSTQLLQAMTRVLAEHVTACSANSSLYDDALVDSIASVFVRLFEAASTTAFVPRFGTFKPPTDVFATFFHSSLTSLLALAAVFPSATIASFGLAILKTHHALQTNQTNKKNVFLACKHSLATLVTLRASTAALLPYTKDMLQALDASVADALFDPEHLHGYGGLVVASSQYPPPPPSATAEDDATATAAPVKKKAKGDGHRSGAAAKAPMQSYQHGLFQEVSQLLTDATVASHVAPFVHMLVREYATYIRRASVASGHIVVVDKKGLKRKGGASAKPDAITPAFAFWLEMCAVTTKFLHLSPPPSSREQQQADGSALWHCLWDVMNASDIYRVAEDNAAQHQFYYLEQIVASVMHHLVAGATAATDTALLSNMVQCSPKILQPHLAHVFAYLSAHSASAGDASMDRAAACLASLVASYDAMRLLEEFLAVLFQGAANSLQQLSNLFSHGHHLDAAIRAAFANMPAGQIESLWLFFHDAVYRAMNAKDALNDGQLRLVRTVFALYMQEVPVSQHIQPVLLQCAKQTFDLVLLPHAVATPSKASKPSQVVLQREALCLLGELLALTDKGVDVSFVVTAVFDPNDAVGVFAHAIPSIFADGRDDDATSRDYEQGILKLCATRVRQLVSMFRTTDAGAVASFALDQAARCLAHVAAITPFLNELGHAATESSCERFLNAITLAAIDRALAPNLFLDAGFYEIRPFLRVIPAAFATILSRRMAAMWPTAAKSKKKADTAGAAPTLAALKSQLNGPKPVKVDVAALPPLQAAVDFMKAVPIPSEVGVSTDDLFGCILDVETLLTLSLGAADKTYEAQLGAIVDVLHEWLQSLLANVAAPLTPSALALLDAWTSALLSRPLSLQSNFDLWKAICRVYVLFHPKSMAPINDAVVALATAPSSKGNQRDSTKATPMDVVAQCLESWGPSSHALGDRMFNALLPALLGRFNHQPTSEDAHVLAAALQYCYRAKGGRVHPSLLPFIGPFLALACRQVVTEGQIGGDPSPSARLIRVVCGQARGLSLDLATVGRLVATLLITFDKNPSEATPPFELLVENSTPDEFHLVWHTLTTEITVLNDPARVVAALRAMLVVLRLERGAKNQRVLADSAKTTLATLVNLCNDGAATTDVTDVHVAALRVVAQAFAKGGDAFDWHAADVHVALLALRPLIYVTSCQPSASSTLGDGLVPEVWQQSYLLLLRLLRQYHTTLPQYLPHFVAGCNALLRALLQVAASGSAAPRHPHHTLMLLWASNLTRLYGYMLPHATSFRKHMVYMLAEFFHSHKHDDLPLDVQLTLRPGIYALFDICSKYEKEQLYGTLDSTGKVLLKSIDAHYKETHQYTGKV